MRGRAKVLATALLAGVFAVAVAVPAGAVDPMPSGEVTFGQTVVEPAYNDVTGTLVYLSTPMHAHVNPNFAHSVAPIYLPMYPTGAQVGTLNCLDIPTENCPDHGPLVAGIAAGANPGVYGNGVEGHDHLIAPPGPRRGLQHQLVADPRTVQYLGCGYPHHDDRSDSRA